MGKTIGHSFWSLLQADQKESFASSLSDLFRLKIFPSTFGSTTTLRFSLTASTISCAASSTCKIGINQGTLKQKNNNE